MHDPQEKTVSAATPGVGIDAHAERLRASGILGRSGLIQRLFDFLLECAHTGRVPKEIEVAIDGFGKDARFDASQDALVRVYVHKLRRKLEEFYAGAGRDEPQRLVIPRGEYRLALEPREAASAGLSAEPELTRGWPARLPRLSPREWFAGVTIGVLIVAVAVLGALQWRSTSADADLMAARRSAIWAPLLNDDLPIYIVLGDYYIFGEGDNGSQVDRLVRDFSINSHDDFERHLQRNPELAQRYTDLNLAYLPTASAYALRDVMPILAAANKRVGIVMASQLDPSLFKTAHVIYIGYLSGLGMLGDIVFAGSRFTIGASYDELVDVATGTSYLSEAGGPVKDAVRYRDYGYFSTFAGPNGNQNLIIAGTRDTAVMQTAETLTGGRRLQELIAKAGSSHDAFEALYEVYGVNRTNIEARLLLTAPLHTDGIWQESADVAPLRSASVDAPATPK
jgi:hypothetical protein